MKNRTKIASRDSLDETVGLSSYLQEDGEAEEDAAEDGSETKTGVRHEDGASTALVG